jgi:hypothetical protein
MHISSRAVCAGRHRPVELRESGSSRTGADGRKPPAPAGPSRVLAALEPASTGEILELHHAKHHAAYVKGANDMLDRLAEARDKGDFTHLVRLEKTFAFNLSGHVLHSIFWQNLPPTAATARTEPAGTPSTSTSALSRPSRSS